MRPMDPIAYKALTPDALRPGGLRLTATAAGLTRVELWTEMPELWRGGSGFEVAAGGPRNATLEQATEELAEYFDGRRTRFETSLVLGGGDSVGGDSVEGEGSFQHRVWNLLRHIPYGSTWTYGDLAAKVASRKSARAVGQAVGRNPLAIFVPCHRVVGKDGSLTGFSCGLPLKVKLLELEGIRLGAAGRGPRRVVGSASFAG